jgi:hypothetical protein
MFMAIDQYGETFHGLKNPRKDLMNRIGCKHATKMYVDQKDGSTKNIGYLIGGHWLTIYKVERVEKPA